MDFLAIDIRVSQPACVRTSSKMVVKMQAKRGNYSMNVYAFPFVDDFLRFCFLPFLPHFFFI